MHHIIISTAHRCEFIRPGEFTLKDCWQKESAADYLKFFLLANFPVHVKDEGLEDEPRKCLKYYGQTVWEEGQTKAKFWGNTYEVISGQLSVVGNQCSVFSHQLSVPRAANVPVQL